MKLIRIILITFITVITVINITPPPVHAQSLSLSLSPPSLEIIIKPGISITYAVKITNNGDSSTILTPEVTKLNEYGVINDPNFIPDKWISLLNTDIALNRPFPLAKGATQQLILRINPSADLKEDDYYRALVISTKPNQAKDASVSIISESLALPLLISITSTGILDRSASISQFSVPQIIDSFNPLNVDIYIKNTGKSYFHPNGKISLTGPLGQSNFSLIPEVILPNEEKKLVTDYNGSDSSHTLSLSGFYLGKYEVRTDFRLDDGKITIGQKKTVYALPYKAAGGVILLILFILFIKKKK